MPANIYKLKDGTIVPGTTTICGLLDKGAGITNWAHKIAYESTKELIIESFNNPDRPVGELSIPDYNEIKKWQTVLKEAGDIGTLVHEIVLTYLDTGQIPPSVNKEPIIKQCLEKFINWWGHEAANGVSVIVEKPLVSEKLKFGGQLDIFLPDKKKLIDIKTSNGIYDSFWLQLAGYDILLRENGYKVDEYQILWLPKGEGFACPIRTDLRKEKKIFKHLLEIHKLRK